MKKRCKRRIWQRVSVDLSTYEKAIVRTVNRIRSGHPDLKVLA